MNQVYPTRLRRGLLTAAATLALLGGTEAAQAASSEELLRTARSACLQQAASQGWKTDQATVVSSRTLSADRVEIVFNLTRDGVHQARLTCPYSVRQGVLGALGQLGAEVNGNVQRTDFGTDFSRSMATTGDAGRPVDRSRGWWLLLPIGLAGLSWAALRSRERQAGSLPTPLNTEPDQAPESSGRRTATSFIAEARGSGGRVRIHELADDTSLVRREVTNGQALSLTGRRSGAWLEMDGGGWVNERDIHQRQVNLATARPQ
jgi:hypothetical protein